jgi:hypothetical protein
MIAKWLYFCFPLLYLAHMHEKYWTGFTHKFPPPQLAGPLGDRAFWVGNPLFMNVVTAVGMAYLLDVEGVFFWAVVCAAFFLGNAIIHGLWSAVTKRYQPGLVTGLLYAPLFCVWLWLVSAEGDVPWRTVGLAMVIGMAIMGAMGRAAVLGRRLSR